MSFVKNALGAATNLLKDEVKNLVKVAAMYNYEVGKINEVLEAFKVANVLKSDLFLYIFKGTDFQIDSIANVNMLLTGFDIPQDFGITWDMNAQQFFHSVPSLKALNSVRVRFIAPDWNITKSSYYKAFFKQFTDDGLLKINTIPYNAVIGYWVISDADYFNFKSLLYLKDIKLGVPMITEYNPKSSDLAEWAGVISFDDYNYQMSEYK